MDQGATQLHIQGAWSDLLTNAVQMQCKLAATWVQELPTYCKSCYILAASCAGMPSRGTGHTGHIIMGMTGQVTQGVIVRLISRSVLLYCPSFCRSVCALFVTMPRTKSKVLRRQETPNESTPADEETPLQGQ